MSYPFIKILALISICFSSAVVSQAQKSPGTQKGGGQSSQSQTGQSSGGQGGGGGSPFFETEMLAYGGVNELAYAIAESVCSSAAIPNGSRILIYDQTSLQNLQAWQAFKSTGEMLRSAYNTLLPPPAPPAPTSKNFAPALSTSSASSSAFFAGSDVSNLITALAASTTNTASTFNIPDSTMAVALLHQFLRVAGCSGKLKLKYFPLKGDSAGSAKAAASLDAVLTPVNEARAAVQQLVNGLGGSTDVTKNSEYLVFADLNTQYDQWIGAVINGISQNQTSTQFTPGPNVGITSLLQGAEIEADMTDPHTFLLYANVVVAGGTQRDRKNIFSLFLGDFITYSGGLVVNVGMVQPVTDSLIMADVLRYRTANTRLHGVHESKYVESTDSGDNVYSLCNNERRGAWPGGAASDPPCLALKEK